MSDMAAVCAWIAFLERTSDALNSTASRPASWVASLAAVVLPMPGGPESSAAFLSAFPALKSRSQSVSRLAAAWLPMSSSKQEGA